MNDHFDDDDDDIWGEKATAAYIAALENLVDRAAELLSQHRTPDAGQLRTAWDKDCDEWFKDFNECRSGREAQAGDGE